MFHLPNISFDDHEPTIQDVMVLLLSIDRTLDGIFDRMHERRCDPDGYHTDMYDDEERIPSMFTAVAFLDHEERIEKLEALFKKTDS